MVTMEGDASSMIQHAILGALEQAIIYTLDINGILCA